MMPLAAVPTKSATRFTMWYVGETGRQKDRQRHTGKFAQDLSIYSHTFHSTLSPPQLFHQQQGALSALNQRVMRAPQGSKEKEALESELDEQIRNILLTDDELAHYELYAWFLHLGADHRLVKVNFCGRR